MVKSQVVSVTPALHADNHRTGGSDPLTGAVGIDIGDFTETEAFSGAAPTVYTDLDLSAIVGAVSRKVLLKVKQTIGNTGFFFRKNGDTEPLESDTASAAGVNNTSTQANKAVYITVITDSAGIVEWKATSNNATTVDVIHFL